jgi:tetratricopeptide (TPR) repeat protein
LISVLGGSTLRELARREALLLSFLAVAIPVEAVAKFLGIRWLELVGLLIAVAGALVRTGIAIRRSRLEKETETVERQRRTRVPVAKIGAIEPTRVGVDAAPPQTLLPGGDVPRYVPRDVDGDLRSAIRSALDGSGRWIVIAVGSSKVGKSRALFEALLNDAGAADLDFVAPVDADALKTLLTPGEMPALSPAGSILWIDDLEPFVNKGMTLQTLQEWHERNGKCVVVATYGGKGNEMVGGSGARELATIADEILQRGCEIAVTYTTARELDPLRGQVPDDAMRSIEGHGLAAYLVAAPKLERKLSTGIHATGDQACPEGVAVVRATVDWARCGRTDSIPEDALRRLWPEYLPKNVRPTDAAFELGLEWALSPVAGTVSLIERANSYLAYDYVVRLIAGAPGAEPPPDAAWEAVLDGVSDAQALAVGISAFESDRYPYAADAFEIAREGSNAIAVAIAGVNLGTTFRELERYEDAVAAFTFMSRFEDSPNPALREGAAFSLASKGLTLADLGRHEEAIATLDGLVARFGDAPESALLAQAARGLLNKGIILGDLKRPDESVAAYDDLVARFGDSSDSDVLEGVANALFNKGVTLTEFQHFEEAIRTYEDLIARMQGATYTPLRERVGMAMSNRATCMVRLGFPDEGLAAYDEMVGHFGDAPEGALLLLAANALINKATTLGELDRDQDELAAYDEVLTRFGDSEAPALRGPIAHALVNRGSVLHHLDRPDEAMVAYDEAAKRLVDAREPMLREAAVRALLGRAGVLGSLERYEDELAGYDEIASRFGAAEEPKVRELVALTMFSKGARLHRLDRPDEAIEALDLAARLGTGADSDLQTAAVMALHEKTMVLRDSGRFEEAIVACDALAARFGESTVPTLRRAAGVALYNKGVTLGEIGRPEEALATYEELLAWIGDTAEEDLRELAARTQQAMAETQAD